MKRGLLIVLLGVAFTHALFAQTLKPGVLVIGNGANAVGAGVQSAVSGVKTILLLQGTDISVSGGNENISSGLDQKLFFQTMSNAQGRNIRSVVNDWADTVKNLTIIKNIAWTKLKKSGSGWSVQLSDGRSIKAGVLVNADQSGAVNTALELKNVPEQWKPFTYDNNTYRTAIASGYAVNGKTSNVLFLDALLLAGQDNLVALDSQHESLLAGQAAGATAAYAAFFKSKTSEANLKTIQGELINYKLSLVPFTDISNVDSNWKSIQFIGLSGFLKAEITDKGFYFNPNKIVTTAEIKEVVKEYFYKAQIWFDDNQQPEMTLGSTLSLICYVGGKSPLNTELEIKKKWKTVYRFTGEFDAAKAITRREFAVLVSEYLKPFNVNIDKTGRVLR